jgi:hypothetical protein
MSSHARRLLTRPVGRPLERLEDRSVPATLVTLAANGTDPLNAPVDILATSDDGNFILFQTKATNVVTGQIDPVGTTDLFWRDVGGNRTELLSGLDQSLPGATAGVSRTKTLGVEASSPGVFNNAVMSGDGQVVAFLSGGTASRYDVNLPGVTDDAGLDCFRWTNSNNFVRLVSQDAAGFAVGTYALVSNPGLSGAGNAVGFISNAVPSVRFDGKFISGSKDGVVLREPAGPNLFVKFNDDLPRLVTYDGANVISRNKLDPQDKSADFFYPYGDVSVDPLGRYISDQGFSYVVMRDYRNNRTLLPSQGAFGFFPTFVPLFTSTDTSSGFLFNNDLLLGQNKDAYRFSFAGVGLDPPRQLVEDLLSFGSVTYTDQETGTVQVAGFQGVSQVGSVQNVTIARDRGDIAAYTVKLDTEITGSFGNVGFGFGTDGKVNFISDEITTTPAGTFDVGFEPVVGYESNSTDRTDLFLARFTAGTTGFQYTSFLVTGASGSTTAGQGAAVGSDDFRGVLDNGPRGFTLTSDGSKVSYATSATDVLTGVTDKNRARDVFQFDSVTGETKLVSVSATADLLTAQGDSFNPQMTQDGQLVGFESTAGDLTVDRFNNRVPDTNGLLDVFVRDVATKVTTQASLAPGNGESGNAKSYNAVLGGTFQNGKVYYVSASTNLDERGTVVPPGTPPQGYGTNLPLLLPQLPRFVAFSGGGGSVTFSTTALNGNLNTLRTVQPFGKNYTGELRVATGDFNGDGALDVVVGAGPGGGPRVAVLDGATGRAIKDYFAFEPRFTGGVYVALGDIDGDGRADVIVGAGEGGGPRVQVTSAKTDRVILDAFVYESTFRGGARVAAGDVTGDGRTDLVTGAGIGGGPRISVFDGVQAATGGLATFANFFAYEETLRGGAYVSVGDFNGDGKADIVTGGGPDGGPRVTVFDATNIVTFDPNRRSRFLDFFAYDEASRNGARPVLKDIDGDGTGDLVVGTGNGFPLIKTFSGQERGVGDGAGSGLPLQTLNPFTGTISLSGAWVG